MESVWVILPRCPQRLQSCSQLLAVQVPRVLVMLLETSGQHNCLHLSGKHLVNREFINNSINA